MSKPKTVSMRMKKEEIYEQGLHIWRVSKKLYQEVQKLSLVNASLINSLKYILENVEGFNVEYEENLTTPEKKNTSKRDKEGLECQ